jgi:hypothetical protein
MPQDIMTIQYNAVLEIPCCCEFRKLVAEVHILAVSQLNVFHLVANYVVKYILIINSSRCFGIVSGLARDL